MTDTNQLIGNIDKMITKYIHQPKPSNTAIPPYRHNFNNENFLETKTKRNKYQTQDFDKLLLLFILRSTGVLSRGTCLLLSEL